jgi:cytochrome c oxidase subunit 2
MKYGRHFVNVIVLVVIVSVAVYVLLAGLQPLGIDWPGIFRLAVPASAEARPIDNLFTIHFVLISFFWSLVVVFVVYSLVVFRRRPDDDPEEAGDHFHGHTGLEVAWTIVPLAIVVALGVWGTTALNEITAPAPDAMRVTAIGQQWIWQFRYPDLDNITTTELVLPVDQAVEVELFSLDVLHSFWVPEFRVKQDLLPVPNPVDVDDPLNADHKRYLRITPTEIGEYKLLCAEICGAQHHSMRASLRVVSQEDYEAWAQELLANDISELTAEERGALWYEQYGCNACHSLDGVAGVGPSWQGLFGAERPDADGGDPVVADEEYLRSSIVNPNDYIVEGYLPNVMPLNFGERFAADEAGLPIEGISIVEDLIAFIKTIE